MTWKDIPNLTHEQATYVRTLRIDEGATWRAVASACAERFKGDWDSNQIAGMELCEHAARHFGEDYFEEPWN